MGDLPHYFDIILFAMVAAFLVLRLRSVLGRRTGNERPPRPVAARARCRRPSRLADKVVPLGAAPQRRHRRSPTAPPADAVAGGLAQIAPPIPAFDRRSSSKARGRLRDDRRRLCRRRQGRGFGRC